MISLSLFILLTAAALSTILVTPMQMARCATICFFISAIICINNFNIPAIGFGVSLYNNLIQVNSTTQAIDAFIFIVASIIVGIIWIAQNYIKTNSSINSFIPAQSEYSIILIFTTIGGSILISSNSLITLYLGVELQSFAVYVLSALYRDSENASAAALKYFFMGGLSSAFILIGSAIIYWQTGTIDFNNIFYLINNIPINSTNLESTYASIILGFENILFGILIKISAAPFYNWAPDVYDGVPTVVTTWLTTIPKITLFTFLIYLTNEILNQSSIWFYPSTWSTILVTCSAVSIIIGTIVGLAETRIKRLLAYSTISHVGFILLALSVNTQIGVDSFIFYIIQYTLTTLTAFIILIGFSYSQINNTKIRDIEFNIDLAGQYNINPILGISFSICLFSIAGIPPFIGFFGKQAVLFAALESGYGFLAIIGIVTSVISASYYLNLVKMIYFERIENYNSIRFIEISSIHSYIISIFTLIILIFIFSPNIVLDSTSLLAIAYYSS